MNVLLGQKAYFQGEFAVTFREGTPPKTNIAPENGWMEDEVPFGMVYFQVSLLLVSGRVGESKISEVFFLSRFL